MDAHAGHRLDPGGRPLDSNAFTWTEGTTSQPTETVTSADAAGNNSAATTLTFKNDSTAPTGGALKVNAVSATPAADQLQRDRRLHDRDPYRLHGARHSTTLRARLEHAHRPVGDGDQQHLRELRLADDLIGNPTQAGLTTGCYLFTLTGTDNVGNAAAIGTTVIVDTTTTRRRRRSRSPASTTPTTAARSARCSSARRRAARTPSPRRRAMPTRPSPR